MPVPRHLDQNLGDEIARWSRKWSPPGRSMVARPLGRRAPEALTWRTQGGAVSVGLSTGATLAIGERICGLQPCDRSPAERDLLEEIAGECLTDLRQRLSAWIGAPREADWCATPIAPALVSLLDDEPRPSLAVGMTSELFDTLVRRALPAPAAPSLGDGHAALAGVIVAPHVVVGSCTITVADLQGLGVGDVLVLDRLLVDRLRLALGGVKLARGRCTIAGGARPSPILVEPLL